MATIIKTDEAPETAGRPVLPRAVYVWRCLAVDNSPSKKTGNSMLKLTWELCSPEKIKGQPVPDGNGGFKPATELAVAGIQTSDWIVFSADNNRSLTKFKQLNASVKHPNAASGVDIDDPIQTHHYVGKAVKALTRTEGGPVKDENTQQVVIGADGQPVIDNNYRIDQYLGEAPEFTVDADKVPY